MLICHCRAVNDRAIRAAIAAGARGTAELARGCGAGSRCGGCIPALLQLLEETGRDHGDQLMVERRVSAA